MNLHRVSKLEKLKFSKSNLKQLCINIDNKGIGLHVEKILTNFLKNERNVAP